MRTVNPIEHSTAARSIAPSGAGDSVVYADPARSALHVVGSSVCGPGHIDGNTPCQDAWMVGRYSFGDVLVISDGMGSRPHADIGAKAACRAVINAARLWGMHQGAPPTSMIKLVHHIWSLLIHPYPPEDCVATCIFAILFTRGQLFAAQLGDGLLYLEAGDSPFCLVEGKNAEFSNETIGLGLAKSLSDWHFTEKPMPSAFTMMLCTDGVADDILPERRGDLVGYLRGELEPLPPRRRSSLLRRELTNWPTPGHVDDKTVVLAWQQRLMSE